MPIRFRCTRCNRLLGIARRKAGAETVCPHCGAAIRVPSSEIDRTELAEIDDLVNPAQSAAPAVSVRAAPVVVAPLPSKPGPSRIATVDDRPLFERDLEAVLGTSNTSNGLIEPKKKPAEEIGADALSLNDERGPIVLSSQKATALAIAVVVLLALAFIAGYLVGAR